MFKKSFKNYIIELNFITPINGYLWINSWKLKWDPLISPNISNDFKNEFWILLYEF